MAACLCVALGLLGVPAHGRAATPLEIGTLDNAYALSDPAAFWQDVESLGLTWVRFDLRWDQIATTEPTDPSSPVDPAYRWAQADAFVRAADRHGYTGRILFTVWGTPTWAIDPAYLATPVDRAIGDDWEAGTQIPGAVAQMPRRAAWQSFVTAAAARYSGRLDLDGPRDGRPLPEVGWWEVWNEPNYAGALRPQYDRAGNPLSPQLYAYLVADAGYALRDVLSAPTVVAGALYRSAPATGNWGAVGPRRFMEELAAREVSFDVLSLHPYNCDVDAGIADGADPPAQAGRCYTVGNLAAFVATVNRIFAPSTPPIWLTEFGLQTGYGAVPKARSVSEQAQARYLTDAFTAIAAQPQIERASWFLLKDDPLMPGRATWQSGVRRTIDTGYAPKPSYAAWQQAIGRLSQQP